MGNRSFKLKGENLAAINGRLRLRYKGISYIKDYYTKLMDEINDVYYIKFVKINSVTETILVEYDKQANAEIDEVVDVINNIVGKYSLDVYKGYIETKKIEGAGRYEMIINSLERF